MRTPKYISRILRWNSMRKVTWSHPQLFQGRGAAVVTPVRGSPVHNWDYPGGHLMCVQSNWCKPRLFPELDDLQSLASLVGAHWAGKQVQLHQGRQRQLLTNDRAPGCRRTASYNFQSTGLSPTQVTGVPVSAPREEFQGDVGRDKWKSVAQCVEHTVFYLLVNSVNISWGHTSPTNLSVAFHFTNPYWTIRGYFQKLS